MIGKDVKIGPFVTIDENVVIGDGTIIDSNAVIHSGARIGNNCHIHSGAVVSDIPQDLKFQGEDSLTIIGDNTSMAYVYLKATEGGDRVDQKFEQNIVMAHVYGLKVGSYHFYRPKTEQRKQLENFVSQCIPEEQDLIPMIDIETTNGLPTDEFCDSLFSFLEMVEEAYHQKPLLYTFRNFYNRHLLGKLDGYKLMIAMYTPEEPVLEDERDITMWQYTGKGRLTGVNGFVDKSRFMGSHSLREIRFEHGFQDSVME